LSPLEWNIKELRRFNASQAKRQIINRILGRPTPLHGWGIEVSPTLSELEQQLTEEQRIEYEEQIMMARLEGDW